MSRTRQWSAAGVAMLVVAGVVAAVLARRSNDMTQPAPQAATSPGLSATPGPSPAGIEPVIDSNFPDPDVLVVGSTYYAFATEQPGGSNVRAISSADLVSWTDLPDALPVLPEWAGEGRTWAPEVFQSGAGRFVLYFTARHAESDRQCIGVAVSTKPAGPFEALGDTPLICPLEEGGAIDATSFQEGTGQRYILWKNDGNCCGRDTWIYLQKVSADGTKLTGEPQQLIKQDKDFEGNLVEAPTLWKEGARYYLFYSANDYSGENYISSYATASEITGPYVKAASPLMTTASFGGEVVGPGGQDVFIAADGRPRIAFHGWRYVNTFRSLYVRPLTFDESGPVVAGTNR